MEKPKKKRKANRISERKARIAKARTEAATLRRIEREVKEGIEKRMIVLKRQQAMLPEEIKWEQNSIETKVKQKRLLEAMRKTLGVVTPACRASGVSYQAYKKWMDNDDWFNMKVEEMGEISLDFAESSLHKQIDAGIPASTIFLLKTKGKKRGYVERQEFVATAVSRFEDLTDEEIDKRLNQTKVIQLGNGTTD